MIEPFVHIEIRRPPRDLVIATADIPDGVSCRALSSDRLPKNWRRIRAPPNLATIGDSFASERTTAILIVPSALVPSEFNWLINPLHADFAKIKIQAVQPFEYDARFFDR